MPGAPEVALIEEGERGDEGDGHGDEEHADRERHAEVPGHEGKTIHQNAEHAGLVARPAPGEREGLVDLGEIEGEAEDYDHQHRPLDVVPRHVPEALPGIGPVYLGQLVQRRSNGLQRG